jgi:hypothetical protein
MLDTHRCAELRVKVVYGLRILLQTTFEAVSRRLKSWVEGGYFDVVNRRYLQQGYASQMPVGNSNIMAAEMCTGISEHCPIEN